MVKYEVIAKDGKGMLIDWDVFYVDNDQSQNGITMENWIKENESKGFKVEKIQRHPGKFEGCPSETIAEMLYGFTMESGQDSELGDVEGFGWYALITNVKEIKGNPSFIVHADNVGFFDYASYNSESDAKTNWDRIESEYEEWENEGESDGDESDQEGG